MNVHCIPINQKEKAEYDLTQDEVFAKEYLALSQEHFAEGKKAYEEMRIRCEAAMRGR